MGYRFDEHYRFYECMDCPAAECLARFAEVPVEGVVDFKLHVDDGFASQRPEFSFVYVEITFDTYWLKEWKSATYDLLIEYIKKQKAESKEVGFAACSVTTG